MTTLDHIRAALALLSEVQRELTAGEVLVAKGTVLLATNELNFALAASHALPAQTVTPTQQADPFGVRPQD
jgi:hypothetical protein